MADAEPHSVPDRPGRPFSARRADVARTGFQVAAIGLAVAVGLCGLLVLAGVAMAAVGMFAGFGSNK